MYTRSLQHSDSNEAVAHRSQGRYDMVCPPISAFDLAAAWPAARLTVVPDAGHSALEPGTRAALLSAVETFRRR